MISTFEESLKYLFSHIPKTEMRKFPGELGLARMKFLMDKLGNPQEKYKVIHIAGTSGKGSTATLISCGIQSQGFTVGLQLSPHLLDIRERIQVNNELLSKVKFVQYLNEIIPTIENVSKSELGEVTYFEILVALAYYSFWKENVEYAVIETGMGGLYDGTNVVNRKDKVSVITKIGFDHVGVLGNTLPEIATQKAGIIQEENTVIVAPQDSSVEAVFSGTASQKHSNHIQLREQDYEVKNISESGTIFVDNRKDKEITLSLIGAHQAENGYVATNVLEYVSQRDKWEIDEKKLMDSFKLVHMPGRMDYVEYKDTTLIVDGAHNTQKMTAFLTALKTIYPNEKHVFLVAFKHGKDIEAMIKNIEKYASEIIVTNFWVDSQDMLNISENPEIVESYITNCPKVTISGVTESLDYASSKSKRVIVTGSLYFSSEVYNKLMANG
jgi:dihydrofolate synthase/folylpolyglutamate synthase